jgi:sugar phosphate isomerase/epimerase
MKIACSSASFADAIADGRLTQLEWLDLSANELEVDGVVFDAAHFPRSDGEYVAQLRKACVDLGLTVAALAEEAFVETSAGDALERAQALGAPLLVFKAPAAGSDPEAWGRFVEGAKSASRLAKACNVTLALRNAPQTLCESGADLKRLAKDVDSAWLRFGPDLASLATDEAATLTPKSVIATYAIAEISRFALDGDAEAASVLNALQRFRGFVVLERTDLSGARDAYHAALERFAALRARSLAALA